MNLTIGFQNRVLISLMLLCILIYLSYHNTNVQNYNNDKVITIKLDSIHQDLKHRVHLDSMYWNHLEDCDYVVKKGVVPYHPDNKL